MTSVRSSAIPSPNQANLSPFSATNHAPYEVCCGFISCKCVWLIFKQEKKEIGEWGQVLAAVLFGQLAQHNGIAFMHLCR